ncbi:unnamed protein product, partial [marine sediment metagenome]
LISVGGSILESRWYTVDGGITNHTFAGTAGNITQVAWDALAEGNVNLIVYLNDTIGNIVSDEVIIIKDTTAPSIQIITPIVSGVYGNSAPLFVVEISDNYIVDSMWYSFNNESTNYMFTTNGTITQAAWNPFLSGSVNIIFYAVDSVGNLNSKEILLQKDVINPVITILEPEMNGIFGRFAPAFQISVDDINLDEVWYTLNGLNDIAVPLFTGALSQTVWESLPDGPITLTFSANDTAGNIGLRNVIIYKDLGEPSPPDQPDIMLIFIIIGV